MQLSPKPRKARESRIRITFRRTKWIMEDICYGVYSLLQDLPLPRCTRAIGTVTWPSSSWTWRIWRTKQRWRLSDWMLQLLGRHTIKYCVFLGAKRPLLIFLRFKYDRYFVQPWLSTAPLKRRKLEKRILEASGIPFDRIFEGWVVLSPLMPFPSAYPRIWMVGLVNEVWSQLCLLLHTFSSITWEKNCFVLFMEVCTL